MRSIINGGSIFAGIRTTGHRQTDIEGLLRFTLHDGSLRRLVSAASVVVASELNFAIDLCDHASGGGEEDGVSDAVDNARSIPEGSVDEGEDAADAGEALETVVETYEAVVAGIGLNHVHVHGEETRSGDDETGADAGFEAQAATRTRLFSAVSRIPESAAALWEVALSADVVFQSRSRFLGVEDAFAHGVLRATPREREAADQAAARLFARRVAHPDVPNVRVGVLAFVHGSFSRSRPGGRRRRDAAAQ